MSTEADLTAIAVELYSGPLAEFTSARDARAKATDDTTIAGRIRALRKPSIAAWVVNVFARERSGQLGEALALAQELREAQADLDAKALAQLGRDRRVLTARLASAAADLAESRGERVTTTTREAVQQTISAAFFDPVAAAAVASGRLVRELEPSGTFAEGAESLVGGGAAEAPVIVVEPADEVAARRERKKAERALHDAQRLRDRRAHDQARAESRAERTSTRIAELTAREAELERELSQVRRDLELCRTEARSSTQEHADAVARLSEAVDAVARAESALAALDDARTR